MRCLLVLPSGSFTLDFQPRDLCLSTHGNILPILLHLLLPFAIFIVAPTKRMAPPNLGSEQDNDMTF